MAKLLCSITELTQLLILLALESMEARLVIMNESLLQEEARELQEALVGLLALEVPVKEVLEALVLRSGRIVPKADLERLVLGFESELASNALEVHVSALRRKLGRELIETVRGAGYVLRDSD